MARWKPDVTPLNDGVLIERTPTETRIGLIIIPETAQDKVAKGTVVAIDGDMDSPVAVGDVVMFGKYDGTDLTIDGHDCVLVKKADLTCRVDE